MIKYALPYKFGFNGQMMNNEVKGLGNSYSAMHWEYDSRIGRRWNIDPMNIGGTSGYATFGNNPIIYTDPLGLDTVSSSKKAKVGDVFQHTHGNSNFFWNKTSTGFEGGGSSANLSTVYVTAKKIRYNNYINWPEINEDQLAWNDKMFARIRDNQPLQQIGDPNWLVGQSSFHLQNYQAQQDGRLLQGIFFGSMAAPVIATGLVETGAGYYLIPRLGFSPGGAAADFINQKFVQGKSWNDYNFASTITNGVFGGGSVFTNALWGSTGSLIDLSVTGVRNGTVFTLTNDKWVSFKASFVGNMVGGGLTFGFNKLGLVPITTGTLYTRTAGYILYNTSDGANAFFGNLISNRVEEGIKK